MGVLVLLIGGVFVFQLMCLFFRGVFVSLTRGVFILMTRGVLVLLKLCGAPDFVEFVFGRFYSFTLQSPIQILLSVFLWVHLTTINISAKRAHPWAFNLIANFLFKLESGAPELPSVCEFTRKMSNEHTPGRFPERVHSWKAPRLMSLIRLLAFYVSDFSSLIQLSLRIKLSKSCVALSTRIVIPQFEWTFCQQNYNGQWYVNWCSNRLQQCQSRLNREVHFSLSIIDFSKCQGTQE